MWVLWAFACASLNATSSAATKRAAEAGGAATATFWTYALSIPFALGTLLVAGMPAIQPGYWPLFAVVVAANIVAITLRNLGLKLSPLSLTIPFLAFTPVFLLLTESLMLGERPGPRGVAGVALIVAGAYALNLDRARTGPLDPLRAVLRERGSLLMLLVAIMWSVTSILDKMCVVRSSPAFYLAAFHLAFVAGYLPLIALRRRAFAAAAASHWQLYAAIAIIHFGSVFAQMVAIKLTLVSYVIAIKRSGMLLSVLAGAVFFGERGLRQRLGGALLMTIGVTLVLFD